ncbi:MAG: hypothetical protein CVV05_09990 [Gammaproteobacteria bacterium HGW-Gammaproteobacteria-1]|jgi:hypothetical protein|nr:MAG: hypothetical protein CVV05_09990 [Gammaproteobacteria bacterium HGW-Gammaproteobacteria-1]
MSNNLLPFRSRRPLLCLCILPLLWGPTAIADAPDPGAGNPITSPTNLTIFSVDDIGLLASSTTVTNTTLLDFSANNTKLTQWSQTGQKLQSGDPCLNTPSRRLIAGRVSSPKFAQPICVTPFSVSLYPGNHGVATGEYLAYNFTDPGTGISARDFDAAAGLMSWIADEKELLHMNIAVARRNLNSKLALNIIGYRQVKEDTKGSLVSLANWLDTSGDPVTGDVAIALGDYDNDGELEILVATDITTGEAGPGKLILRSFSYAAKTHELKAESIYAIDTVARPRSITLAAGDFASLGFDQAILGYYTADSKGTVELAMLRLGDKLKIDPPSPRQKLSSTPAQGSYFAMAAGLFHFDPGTSQSDTSFAFHSRQLALAWAERDGSIKAQIVRTSPQLTQFEVSPAQTLSSSTYPSRTDSVGPALAVGNFIGLQDNSVSPLNQLAVVIPTRSDATPTASIPELVVATIDYHTQSNLFTIHRAWSDRQSIYETSGIQYSPGAVGLDSRGMSYYLGTPAHIRVQDMIDPQYVIYMPPRHADCLMISADDTNCTMVNISADTNFTVELVDSHEETLQQSSTDQMSTDFGSSASMSISGTVGAGIMEIAELETTTSVKTAFSYEQQTMERSVNTSYKSILTQNSATTSMDDHLIWNARTIDIWRYPVYGMNLQTPDKFPYYDVLVPGQLHQYSGGGRSMDWFSPRHMNNNLLSYPNISDTAFPNDLGDFTYNDKAGKRVTVKEPLNAGVIRSFDGNMQTFRLDYTDEAGGSSEKSFAYSLANSTDISIGFKASAKIELVNLSTDTEGAVSLNTKASWENSELSERSVKNSRGITLNQPEVDWITDKSYNYRTLVYITSNGGLKVAHAVDPLGTMSGRGWWKRTYGGLPDPAVNLPNRLVYSWDEGRWGLNTDDSYSQMRGIALTSATYDEETKSYPYLSGGVEEGTKVRVVANIYNLSVDTVAKGVKVKFAYQALDPDGITPVGDPVPFATSQPLELPVWGVKEIAGVWDTTGLAGSTGTPYRFVVTLDTGGMKEIHGNDPATGGNNHGYWPWSGSYFEIFKRGTKNLLATSRPAHEPMVKLDVRRRQNGIPYAAEINIEHTHNDPALRHLLLVQPRDDEDGPHKVIASRTLWGVHKGKRRLRIPLHDLKESLPQLRVILTKGTP